MPLHSYQQGIYDQGKQILSDTGMLYLGLEMRLGKSYIALELSKQYENTLFVTTKSAMKGIEKAALDLDIDSTLETVAIINYESLHKIDKSRQWDLIIIDEAHKISAFPKKNKARKLLDDIIDTDTHVMWLSGTPQIESTAQLYHQLTLAPNHAWNEYSTFYKWFKTYGVSKQKFIGYGRLANDYSETKDLSEFYSSILLTYTKQEAGFEFHAPDIKLKYIDMPDEVREHYTSMASTGMAQGDGWVSVDNGGGAARRSKLQQMAGGTLIDYEENKLVLSPFKANHIKRHYNMFAKIAVFYKYVAERMILEEVLNDFTDIEYYQIDASNTGMDLSHLQHLIIYSLTFSGSNYAQVLDRMAHTDRDTPMEVDILLTKESIDLDIYEAVSNKKDFNSKFYANT